MPFSPVTSRPLKRGRPLRSCPEPTSRRQSPYCRESLTKAGLAEYRKGNLEKAIAVWESLLVFDPDNAEIKKAVETAKTQLNEILKKK